MAITRDRVTLSQVNFNIAKYDYTDNVPYPGVYFDGPYNTFADLAGIQRNNVFLQMLLFGISEMNLYDHEQNVIGYIKMENFTYEYVTYQLYRVPGSGDTIWTDEQVDSAICPMYRSDDQYHEYFAGVQFRRVVGLAGSNYEIKYTVNLNGSTQSITYFTEACVNIYEWYGSFPVRYVSEVVNLYRIPSVGLMTRTRQGETHTYLNWTEIDYTYNITWDEYVGDGIVYCGYIGKNTVLLADNLNITDYIVPEVEYMNDIENRFCPRWNAGSVGMYAVSWNTIELLMQGIMELDAGDLLKNVFLGGDGKQYIIGIRWYYGLYDNANSWLNLDESKSYKVQVGGVHLDVGGTDLVGKKFDGEYAHWSTSIMDVPRVLDNYLDYFADYQLYLPYYGFLKINANDIVGGTIRVHYNINLVTGMADIIVECKNSRSSRAAYKAYTVNAQIGVDIPFASDVMKTYVASWMETAGKAFMTGASMGAYGATQEYANAIQKSPRADIHQDALNLISSGDQHIMADAERAAMKNAAVSKIKTGLHNAGATAKYTGAEMSAAMSQFATSPSPSITRTGGSNPENGTLDELYPYLVITHPIDNSPADYEDYVGLPACTSIQLNQCTGFTQIAAVKPESMTDAPKYADEILSLLQAGVYL